MVEIKIRFLKNLLGSKKGGGEVILREKPSQNRGPAQTVLWFGVLSNDKRFFLGRGGEDLTWITGRNSLLQYLRQEHGRGNRKEPDRRERK